MGHFTGRLQRPLNFGANHAAPDDAATASARNGHSRGAAPAGDVRCRRHPQHAHGHPRDPDRARQHRSMYGSGFSLGVARWCPLVGATALSQVYVCSEAPHDWFSTWLCWSGCDGGRVTKRLMDAGYVVTGHNRTRARARWLLDAGMRWVDTPHEVAERSDVVFTMVTNTNALEAVVQGGDGVLPG